MADQQDMPPKLTVPKSPASPPSPSQRNRGVPLGSTKGAPQLSHRSDNKRTPAKPSNAPPHKKGSTQTQEAARSAGTPSASDRNGSPSVADGNGYSDQMGLLQAEVTRLSEALAKAESEAATRLERAACERQVAVVVAAAMAASAVRNGGVWRPPVPEAVVAAALAALNGVAPPSAAAGGEPLVPPTHADVSMELPADAGEDRQAAAVADAGAEPVVPAPSPKLELAQAAVPAPTAEPAPTAGPATENGVAAPAAPEESARQRRRSFAIEGFEVDSFSNGTPGPADAGSFNQGSFNQGSFKQGVRRFSAGMEVGSALQGARREASLQTVCEDVESFNDKKDKEREGSFTGPKGGADGGLKGKARRRREHENIHHLAEDTSKIAEEAEAYVHTVHPKSSVRPPPLSCPCP